MSFASCLLRYTSYIKRAAATEAFKDVTWQIAEKDGESSSIEEWRENYREYLEEEADIVGFEFSEDTPVVIEEFEVVYKA